MPKTLLMALNGGVDERYFMQVGPKMPVYEGEVLEYGKVMERFDFYLAWLAKTYVNTMNVIHFMHDKYAYEKLQMALHDTDVERLMAFGIAGLSVIADSLSAIKYAKVKPIKNEQGIIVDFETTGDFPKFGNDDDRVDSIAQEVFKKVYEELCKTPAYRGAKHTLSALTITSNVVYGKKTGATPDGERRANRSRRGRIPCTTARSTGRSRPSIPWRNFPTITARTAYPTPFPSCPKRWVRLKEKRSIIWSLYWTGISRRTPTI